MKYLLATSKKMEHNRSDGRKPQVDNHWPSVIVVALYFSKKGVFRANNSPASVTLGPFDPAVTVGRSIPSPFLLASCLSGFHAFSFLLEPARIAAHQAHTVFAFHASPNPAVMRRQQNCALQFRWQATAAHKPLFVHSACLNCCGASLFPPLIPLPWTNKKLLSHSSATFLLNITLLRCCALFIRWWLIVLPEPLWLFLTSMVAIAVMELKVFGKKFKYLIDGLLAFLSNSLVSHRRFACFSQQLPTVFCLMTNQHCSQIRYTCLITLNAVTSTASSICCLCFTCGRLGKISASPNVSLTYPGIRSTAARRFLWPLRYIPSDWTDRIDRCEYARVRAPHSPSIGQELSTDQSSLSFQADISCSCDAVPPDEATSAIGRMTQTPELLACFASASRVYKFADLAFSIWAVRTVETREVPGRRPQWPACRFGPSMTASRSHAIAQCAWSSLADVIFWY